MKNKLLSIRKQFERKFTDLPISDNFNFGEDNLPSVLWTWIEHQLLKKMKIKKIGKFNLLEMNICRLCCKCGWNLWIGGKDIKDLKKIKSYLKSEK